MSMRYKGSVISATPPTTSSTTATGVWTLPQQMQAQGAGNWPYGGPFTYIEDVFSTWLRVSDGLNTQTVVNGINLSANGGLVWSKPRAVAGENHIWVDSARGVNKYLSSDLTSAQGTMTYPYVFNTNGYTVGNGNFWANGVSLVDWTFRKQPKFFDVVTYTGTGSATTVAHNLGSVPGCIFVKRTDTSANWAVYHTSLANTEYLVLNSTAAKATGATWWNSTTPTSSVFSVGTDASVNASGGTYVAYLFASNAGGFGLTGNDNVITCGSYTGSNSTATTVTLGYEPQWIMIKRATGTASAFTGWAIFDNMRGMPVTGNDNTLLANTSDAENPATANGAFVSPTATGFTLNVPGSNLTNTTDTFIYIAIRRGPMKVPTVGTSVLSLDLGSNASPPRWTSAFPVDWALQRSVDNISDWNGCTRLLQGTYLRVNSTNTETVASVFSFDYMNGWGSQTGAVADSWSTMFQRAPGFFDVVCYTGTSTARTQAHNLGVAPELMIFRRRNTTDDWWVTFNFGASTCKYMNLNLTGAQSDLTYSSTNQYTAAPTATGLLFGSDSITNGPYTYVTYLFATCPGVSKVGSYSGTGATQTINCGFTGGARFVLIKRTDSTGDWYVWDTSRGMVAGTDPSLLVNSADVQVNANSVYTTGVGFQIVSTAAGINASGGTYIFLAVS